MSRIFTRTLLAGIAALTVSTVGASAYDSIDRAQSNQQARIQQGLRDGSLTRHEAARLQAEQARIADFERRAKADGHIDRREGAILGRALNESSRHIYQERHDREARGSTSHRGTWGGWGFRRWW